jgi:hypothetical protein
MAPFSTTTGTKLQLEELIAGASEWLILITPFLRLNDRMNERRRTRTQLFSRPLRHCTRIYF